MRSKKDVMSTIRDNWTFKEILEVLLDIRDELARHNENYEKLAKQLEEDRKESVKVYDLKMQLKEVIDEQ